MLRRFIDKRTAERMAREARRTQDSFRRDHQGMKSPKLSALAILLLAAPLTLAQECGVEVTYLANEGVLLRSGETKVVVDALFRNAMQPYLNHTPETRKALEGGEGEFAGIAAALATHQHADHFDAESVAEFLRNHPRALFAAHAGVTALVQKQAAAPEKQLRASSTDSRESLELNGIRVGVLRLFHNGRKADLNVGYILHLGGKKVLHVGDALDTVENFRRFELASEKLDVALLPYWYAMSEEGIAIVRDHVKAANVIFIHVPPAEADEVRAVTSKHFPASTILEKPLARSCY